MRGPGSCLCCEKVLFPFNYICDKLQDLAAFSFNYICDKAQFFY